MSLPSAAHRARRRAAQTGIAFAIIDCGDEYAVISRGFAASFHAEGGRVVAVVHPSGACNFVEAN